MPVRLLVAAALSAAPQPSYPAVPPCASDGASPFVNMTDVYGAYGARSVAIVTAALRRDSTSLAAFVASNARFVIWRGDAGYRTRTSGPAAAIEFFPRLSPVDYQFLTGFGGPISREICGPITVDLLLEGPDRAANLQFRYHRGILVEVTGREVFVSRGPIRRPRD